MTHNNRTTRKRYPGYCIFRSMLPALCLVLFPYITRGQISQWRGEQRNGHFPGTGLMQQWPEEGPPLVASVEGMGRGFSMPVAYNGIVYVTGSRDSMEYLSAVDLEGNLLWSKPYGAAWDRSFPEARTAPTILENKAYMVSGGGIIACVDIETGDVIWSVDGFRKFEGCCGEWGIAESPLVIDDMVIYTPGGHLTTMVALERHSGETVWMTECLQDTTAYVSPILVNYAGKKMIVQVTARSILGVDAEDGTILWRYRYYDLRTPLWHKWAPVINCISPIYHRGKIYVTSGYNHVGVMLELNGEGTGVSEVWVDSVLDCHHGGVVLLDGCIYGANWTDNSHGDWCCIEWETGRTMYVKPWEVKGSVITDGLRLYCCDERRGNMALVEGNPEDFRIISSFRIPEGSGPYWAHPSIYGGRLLFRHGDVLMIYRIKNA
jgi:outer membrane protein assembly factor BamB